MPAADPSFYPDESQIPAGLRTGEFLLRPLRTTDVELDYAALMVSTEMLRRWNGGNWPEDDFTLQANFADLDKHEQEHLQGLAFTFTMLNLAGDECLGCVYIEPLIAWLKMAQNLDPAELTAVADYQTLVRFWVKQPLLASDLDRRLFLALITWLSRDWAFNKVYFRVNSRDTRQLHLVEEAGLNRVYTLAIPDRHGEFWLYASHGKEDS